MAMNRIFYPYFLWEDWLNGMYATVDQVQFAAMVQDAVLLLTDTAQLYLEMTRATNEWKVSASHNMRSGETNHRAWLGQAACCIASRCTEDATRKAWCELTATQQNAANVVADRSYREYAARFKVQMEFDFCYA